MRWAPGIDKKDGLRKQRKHWRFWPARVVNRRRSWRKGRDRL